MALMVDCLQILLYQLRVDLRGGNVAVAEHLLNGMQVRAIFQQMRRKAVAQGVFSHNFFNF